MIQEFDVTKKPSPDDKRYYFLSGQFNDVLFKKETKLHEEYLKKIKKNKKK